MRLLWVELRDFRNHAHTRIEPIDDGLIVAVGPNGEGKTNLLEGVCYLFTLASPRVSANTPLVRHGAEAAYARGEVETLGGRVLVEVEIPVKGASRVKVNRLGVHASVTSAGRSGPCSSDPTIWTWSAASRRTAAGSWTKP